MPSQRGCSIAHYLIADNFADGIWQTVSDKIGLRHYAAHAREMLLVYLFYLDKYAEAISAILRPKKFKFHTNSGII